MKKKLEQVKKLLEEQYDDGYKNGIAEGFAVAQRIHLWYKNNHTLVDPYPMEKLTQWAEDDLNKLKQKLEKK